MHGVDGPAVKAYFRAEAILAWLPSIGTQYPTSYRHQRVDRMTAEMS